MYVVEEEAFRLEVELGEDDPAEVANADGWVVVPGRGRWAATFLTLDELNRLMARWRLTGEYDAGAHFTCPDLVLLRDPGVDAMLVAVRYLVETGAYESTLVRVEDGNCDVEGSRHLPLEAFPEGG